MVNGQYYALMLAVEEVGEAFAKTNYGSTEGFIFKPEGNGSDLAYVSDDVNNYDGIFSEVKMNKKTAENNSDIITMMKEISEGDTSSLDIEKIAAPRYGVVLIDAILSFAERKELLTFILVLISPIVFYIEHTLIPNHMGPELYYVLLNLYIK